MELQAWHLAAVASLLCAAPSAVLLLEVVFAKRREGERSAAARPPVRFRVLIPAHDEELGLQERLRALIPLLPEPQCALVVADNCSDETAAVAAAEGVEVLVRDEPTRRGKGHALRFGLDHLATDPPEVVVFLDADSTYCSGSPTDLAALACESGRPVQGAFQMEVKRDGALPERVSSLAVRLKNDLRVRGLSTLGGAVSLLGSNFALPWSSCLAVPVPAGELAEDAVWGWRLADSGQAPLYSSRIRCAGELARGAAATKVQRGRWERGTLLGAWRVLPGVALRALARGRLSVLLLAMDGLVPPLSLLSFGCASVAALGLALDAPALVSWVPSGLLLIALMIAWARVGRDLIAPHEALALPLHAGLRLLQLPATLLGGAEWRRTPREHAAEE
ncbi:MAG: glycosyltransferase family 2 protein [Planctomycetes bacterium]|nr:glycosyltransferase family 2 protein [Planctomycetota bacterium]